MNTALSELHHDVDKTGSCGSTLLEKSKVLFKNGPIESLLGGRQFDLNDGLLLDWDGLFNIFLETSQHQRLQKLLESVDFCCRLQVAVFCQKLLLVAIFWNVHELR